MDPCLRLQRQLPPVMIGTLIGVSSVEPMGAVEPEPRSVIAIGRRNDYSHDRRALSPTIATESRDLGRGDLFLNKRHVRFVTSVFHFFDRNEMKSGGVNDVTLSRWRLRVGKHVAEMGVTSLGVDLRPLHVV